ncbi:lipocalin family protein [uncultured Chryseobacterium sp.]|uniref:lipocalin family protein n=1 Tax=uncultured Chryseobacterium sp. TaxID=259322 RepID=UPI0025E57F5C|nr:lipocalin family protein [uncultured Chryseobacterium sp.]
MKLLISFLLMAGMAISCSNSDERENTVLPAPDLNGVWKPVRYEYKGKIYLLADCEKKGQISVNSNFSGVYERYGSTGSSSNCTLYDSFAGNWSYDKVTKILTLTYQENGISKMLKKEVQDFSSVELKITDNSQNLDNVLGNDEASLVFTKQ